MTERPRIEVQDANGRWVDLSPLAGEPLGQSPPGTPAPFPIVVPIAAGWLQRDPAYATVTMRPLPSLHAAPLLSPATWFAWAVDAASVYLAERA